MKTKSLYTLLTMFLALAAQPVQAYQTWNSKWPQPQTTFYVNIPGENGAWNSAFEAAMNSWAPSGFRFSVVRSSSDPCNTSDRRNGVRFHTSVCGSAFGSTTLAVTRSWRTGAKTVETDIVFNSNRNWSLYGGARQSAIDFQRVAVHELGHALGLNHEHDAPAIMAPSVGNVRTPQADDLAGVRALYGPSDDYGNSIGAAHSINPNTMTSGRIDSGTDVDYFKIVVPRSSFLYLGTLGTTRTVGSLYSASGTLLMTN
ncbi:MAG: matrixin family metalloprotease, partial [Thiohalobacteraceae bacterium]